MRASPCWVVIPMSDHDDLVALGLDALLDVHPMAPSRVAVSTVIDAVEPQISARVEDKVRERLRAEVQHRYLVLSLRNGTNSVDFGEFYAKKEAALETLDWVLGLLGGESDD